jgi:starch synthase
MAAGLPVVATRVGGLPELIEDRKTGLLVAAGDAHGMAAAITTLLTDPAKAAAMGTAAQEHVRLEFSLERNAALNFSLYEELCNQSAVASVSTALQPANVTHVNQS